MLLDRPALYLVSKNSPRTTKTARGGLPNDFQILLWSSLNLFEYFEFQMQKMNEEQHPKVAKEAILDCLVVDLDFRSYLHCVARSFKANC